MADETVKITGRATGSHMGDHPYRIDLTVELSLRDLFAAFALAGILASPTRMGEDAADNADKAAEWAYVYADAALSTREGTDK